MSHWFGSFSEKGWGMPIFTSQYILLNTVPNVSLDNLARTKREISDIWNYATILNSIL